MINTNNQTIQTIQTEVRMEEENEPPPDEPSLFSNWFRRMGFISSQNNGMCSRRNEVIMHSCLFGKHCGFVRAFPIYQGK